MLFDCSSLRSRAMITEPMKWRQPKLYRVYFCVVIGLLGREQLTKALSIRLGVRQGAMMVHVQVAGNNHMYLVYTIYES